MTHVFPPFEPEKFERFPRRKVFPRGSVPIRVLIPNIFTLVGLCAGLTAIRMAVEHRFDVALAAIVFAALIDALDGRIARLLKVSSKFGAELDSLADFVDFGVAPAILIFVWGLSGMPSLGWLVVMVFAICAALRLARFNAALDKPDQPVWKGNYFVGIPAPAGALVVLLPLYLNELGMTGPDWFTVPATIAYTLTIAFLMVSRIPTYSGKLVSQKIRREFVLPIFVLAAMFVAVLLTYPFATLAIGTVVYLMFIPLSILTYGNQEQKAGEEARGKNGSQAQARTVASQPHGLPSDDRQTP